MESVLIKNNGESNWEKLDTFGLRSRRSFIGWNRYQGVNSAVHKIDMATGMRVMLIPASIPRSERAVRVPGRRGRPAIVGCRQEFEPQKRGRKPMQGPIMFRAMGQRGRPAFIGPREQLVFSGCHQKRGPKAQDPAMKAAKPVQLNGSPGKKRGRMSVADKIKAAKPGETVHEKNGYWIKLSCGIASWVGQAA